jgi:CubicO group peptidase (beta-lactamase class C family)
MLDGRGDDTDPTAPGNEEVMMTSAPNKDWTRYTVDLPMAGASGMPTAIYCSVDMNLTAAAVSAATKTWLPEFFDNFYARPLQFGSYYWGLTPTGEGYGGGGVYLLPRDSIKLGQLFLSRGVWNGKRVVSQYWTELATTPHSQYDSGQEKSFTGSPGVAGAVHRYGYGWHLLTAQSSIGPLREYMATGNGGQITAVIPKLDMVVAIAGGAYNNQSWRSFVQEFLPNFIIPSAIHSMPATK